MDGSLEVICIDDNNDRNDEQGPITRIPASPALSANHSISAPGASRMLNRSPPKQRGDLIDQSGTFTTISSAIHKCTILHSGLTVELAPHTLDYSVHEGGKLISVYEIFLRIEKIEEWSGHERPSQFFLIGYHFRRSRNCARIVEGPAGEVLCVSTRRVRVCVDAVVRTREMILTNALGRNTFRVSQEDARDNTYGRLICRFKLQTDEDIDLEDQNLSGLKALGKSGSITRWRQAEADEGFGEDDDKLSAAFREGVDSLDMNKEYTCGDMFCGAGGATLGAELAGFSVKFGVDWNVDAMHSWRSNRNPAHGAVGFCEDAFDFVTKSSQQELVGSSRRIDLLHLSTPCQTYSPAHTVPGRNDDANSAMTGIIGQSLKELKPRIASVEETDGIIRLSQHRHFFFWILEQFSSCGYDVSWNVLQALEYGCVSKRSRLIVLASCPGEKLPSFPIPTHFYSRSHSGQEQFEALGGLQPAVTLAGALSSIPMHERIELRDVRGINLNAPFLATITTQSHSFLTNRQRGLLQTFPSTYQFVGNRSSVSRQIGNAYPPTLAASVFKQVMKHLKMSDALRRMRLLFEQADPGDSQDDPITLS